MPYGILADIVVWVHLAFVIFVVGGAGLVVRRRRMLWLHLPAVFWVIWIEFSGKLCPLTPLENWLRIRAGQGGYRGGFVEYYLMPVLYPVGLTHNIQVLMGLLVIIINLALYGLIISQFWRRKRNERRQ